ncbi:transmembrane proteins 14C-domain-containing protein [Protomyces lactucae-debilis]|uniref:Transmembrane proteins 14C-domain-containing protein n=1 Tax=Protomyces lactucae-debilis TaxID=2754530 RepID=A0A1Y2FGI8_PROLT|nr:transmembrane proteins 14C-domain-containing protein [Protomyces lactucae-debilis]ORY83033.1 transmembrane proteins 14C-domain-containing protein [Protomyces lactucae-debilis]
MAPLRPTPDYIGYSYAAITFLGGLIGLIKAGSLASLIASSICASAILYGAMQTSRDPQAVKSILVVSALLAVFFGRKFGKSGKVMPAGLMLALSLASVVYYGKRLL